MRREPGWRAGRTSPCPVMDERVPSHVHPPVQPTTAAALCGCPKVPGSSWCLGQLQQWVPLQEAEALGGTAVPQSLHASL